jgi:thiol:disulfide interchange protein DsbG
MQRRHLLHALAAAGTTALFAACGDKKPTEAPPAAAPAAPLSAQQAYELATQGHGFTIGSVMAANTVYVFFDTTCPHCAHLWMNAKPLLGKLKMVWMPIGLLRPQSGPQGATILSSADPTAAMNENEAKVLDNTGGISAGSSIPDEVVAKVKANTDLFRKTGADSVPLILYKNVKSGTFGSYSGVVETATLADMVGI